MSATGSTLLLTTVLLACAAARQTPAAPRAIVAELAPHGVLRAAINLGNAVLAARDGAGEAYGVSVDLARALASRLGVPVELVVYESAGRVVAEANDDKWDVAFVAIDPARAREVDYSAPFIEMSGAYLVPVASPITRLDEVDHDGVRVVVGNGSAYDLFLARTLRRATIVRAPSSPEVTGVMVAQRLDVAAGVRQQLEADARRFGGLRLLDGNFMVIRHAMAVPKGRAAGVRYLSTFLDDANASGFIAAALERHGVRDVTIAPRQAP